MIVDKKRDEDQNQIQIQIEGELTDEIEEKKTNTVGPTTFEAIEEAEVEQEKSNLVSAVKNSKKRSLKQFETQEEE